VSTGTATASPSEETCRADARAIQEKRPGWLILYGCYTKTYVAFPLFTTRRRGIWVTGYTPRSLLPGLDEAERLYRVSNP